MITRDISDITIRAFREYPIILIQGPRQSGKTTLARNLFPDKKYITLEDIDSRTYASEDPKGFLSTIPEGAILDEVQHVPSLMSYIQGIIDEKNTPGMFVLTGSNNLLLMEAVSQTLSGRIAILTLLPLSIKEEASFADSWSTEKIIISGFYPRLITWDMDRPYFYSNYISTYVERDVRQVLKIRNIDGFQRFLTAIAERTGNILDINAIANDSGVTSKTVSEWLSILQTSYICFLLHPYEKTRTKRLTKKPKLYFYDTGLAAALLGISTEEELRDNRLKGALFENMVIADLIKSSLNRAAQERFMFYRTSDGFEIDLIIQRGRMLYPVEIKAGQTFSTKWTAGINLFMREYPDEAQNGTIIYGGADDGAFKGISIKGYRKFLSMQ